MGFIRDLRLRVGTAEHQLGRPAPFAPATVVHADDRTNRPGILRAMPPGGDQRGCAVLRDIQGRFIDSCQVVLTIAPKSSASASWRLLLQWCFRSSEGQTVPSTTALTQGSSAST